MNRNRFDWTSYYAIFSTEYVFRPFFIFVFHFNSPSDDLMESYGGAGCVDCCREHCRQRTPSVPVSATAPDHRTPPLQMDRGQTAPRRFDFARRSCRLFIGESPTTLCHCNIIMHLCTIFQTRVSWTLRRTSVLSPIFNKYIYSQYKSSLAVRLLRCALFPKRDNNILVN